MLTLMNYYCCSAVLGHTSSNIAEFHRPRSFLGQPKQQQEQHRRHCFKKKWGLQLKQKQKQLPKIRGGGGGKIDHGNIKEDNLDSSRAVKSVPKKTTTLSHYSYTTIGILSIPSSLSSSDDDDIVNENKSFDLIQSTSPCIAIVNRRSDDDTKQETSKRYDISLGKFRTTPSDPSSEGTVSMVNDIAVEALGISSEILLIFLPSSLVSSSSSLSPTTITDTETKPIEQTQLQLQQHQLLTSLKRGIARRCKTAGWSKPKVVVMILDDTDSITNNNSLTSSNKKQQQGELQQKFALSSSLSSWLGGDVENDDNFWTPDYMESLDIVVFDENQLYELIWKDLVSEECQQQQQQQRILDKDIRKNHNTSNDRITVPKESFPKFVKQVIQSLTPKENNNDKVSRLVSMKWSNNNVITIDETDKVHHNMEADIDAAKSYKVDKLKEDQDEAKENVEKIQNDGDNNKVVDLQQKEEKHDETRRDDSSNNNEASLLSSSADQQEKQQLGHPTKIHIHRHHNQDDERGKDDDVQDGEANNHHWMDVAQRVMVSARERMAALEMKQQDVWLQYSDGDDIDEANGKRRVPLLEFGNDANAILVEASKALKGAPMQVRTQVLMTIASGELRQLYHQQLDSLRDHYGRMYETVLEQAIDMEMQDNDDEDDEDVHQKMQQKKEQMKTEAATYATEGFRTAAQHAIPKLCQQGEELEDADYGYVSILQGLLTDMMEATTLREDNEALLLAEEDAEEQEEGKDDSSSKTAKRQRRYKWYEKLAARVVVLGVNYLQGWLAWQGIRKAAAERDRQMPKFPLF